MVRVIAKGGVKPSGRVFTGRSTLGDGDNCPLGDHGKMYAVGRDRQWCPHSDHSRGELTRCFWPLYDIELAIKAYTSSRSTAEPTDYSSTGGAVDLPDIDIGEL